LRQKHEEELRWQQKREREKEAKKHALAQGVIEERQRAVEERHASAAAKRAQAAKQTKAGGPAEAAPAQAQARSSSPPIPTVAKRQPRPPAPPRAGGTQLPVEGKSIAAELADQPVPRKPPGAPVGHSRARVQRRASRLNRGEAVEEDGDKGHGRRGEPPSRRQWGPRPDAHVELPEVHGSYAGGNDGRSEPAQMSSPPIPTHRPRQQEASPEAVRAASPPIPTLRRREEQDRPEEMLQQRPMQQQRSASPPIPTLRRAAAAPAREPVTPVPVQARQPAATLDVHASSTLSPRASVVALTALSKLKQRLQARKAELAREVTQGEELLQHSGQIFAVNEMSRQAASDTLRRGQAIAQADAGLQAEAE
jgi:hypothetical protein